MSELEQAIERLETAAGIWFNQSLHRDLRVLIDAVRKKVEFPKEHPWGPAFNDAAESLAEDPDHHVAGMSDF